MLLACSAELPNYHSCRKKMDLLWLGERADLQQLEMGEKRLPWEQRDRKIPRLLEVVERAPQLDLGEMRSLLLDGKGTCHCIPFC